MKTVERVYDRDEGSKRLRNRATVSIELDSVERSVERTVEKSVERTVEKSVERTEGRDI